MPKTATMAKGTPAKRTYKKKGKAVDNSGPRYDIPYFPHEQLDPKIYPTNVGFPIGGPTAQPRNQILDDDDDDDYDSNLATPEASSDDEWTPRKPRSSAKSATFSSPFHANYKPSSNSYKKVKVEGGRPAMAKKVVADMDSDDELIVNLKMAKRTEKEIAARLVSEGRVAYNPKTIGTRWARMKKVMAKHNDDLMDADLTDWHEGDDDVLRKAIERADKEVEKAKQEAESKKWQIVSDSLKDMKPVTNFSQKACRERFEALEAGTAKTPPELVGNPDEKTIARIQSRIKKENKLRDLQGAGGHGQAYSRMSL